MKNTGALYEIINVEGLQDNGVTVVQVTAFVDDIEFSASGSARRHYSDRQDEGLGYMLALSRATAKLSRKIARAAEQRVIRNDAETRRRREARALELQAAPVAPVKKQAAIARAARPAKAIPARGKTKTAKITN